MIQSDSTITVYTCSTNGRDSLREDQCTTSARFVAYVDQANLTSSVWECIRAKNIFHSARRNARMHKVLAHQFISSEYSIWMDANVSLLMPAPNLINEYLSQSDIAIFKHRTRNCVYEEAQRCIDLGLDSEELISNQAQKYRNDGFAPQQGLAEATVVIRRNTGQVNNFNNAWWSEICTHSVRDQIAFMYAAHKTNTKISFIEPTKYLNPFFSISNRPAGRESVN